MSARGGFFGWLWRLYVWIDYGRYYERGKTVDGNDDTRYTLAVLDNSIIDLAVEAKAARDMAQEATTRAERLGTVRTRLMEVRDKIRHVLPDEGTDEHGRV